MKPSHRTFLAATVCLMLWLPGCKSEDGFSNGTYLGSAGQVLTINGDEFTCSYSTVYTVGAITCSTLMSDAYRADDERGSTGRELVQTLKVAPDQSDQIPTGQGKTYSFYALIQGDTGGVVELARPPAPPGWSARLGDSAGLNDLPDTDGDGLPDLGYVVPGESSWFSLEVTTPVGLVGDTAALRTRTFLLAGHLGSNSLVADTAVLSLTPVFSGDFSGTFITNGDSVIFTTTHINGQPIGLRHSATFDFVSNANSFILSNMRDLIDGGCGITPDMYTKGN